jgi:flagellar assembly protein FliH
MATLSMPLLDLDKQVVDELVEVSMAVVRQMVRRELKISPGEVVAVVKEALSVLPVTAGDVQLVLHPEDAALVRTALLGSDTESPWQIIEDPVLSRGGCRVLTNTSRIDATVENRINAAIAAVMGGERQVDQSS